MTPEEEFRKALICLKLAVDPSVVKDLFCLWRADRRAAQRKAVEEAIHFASQALRNIPTLYVSQPERNVYNEALDDACAAVGALSVEEILSEVSRGPVEAVKTTT